MRFGVRSLAWLAACVTLGIAGCSSDEAPAQPDARAAEDTSFRDAARVTLRGYAKVGRTNYDESVRLAKLMEKAIEDLTKAPSQQLLDGARTAWRTARDAYGRAEAFRFAGGPLDEDPALLARIEQAPVDLRLLEGGPEGGGLIDMFAVNTDVTSYAIIAAARERSVPMGWHAIEAMLWDADAHTGAPRAFGDFDAREPTSKSARRGRLTAKLARILIEDLDVAANQWDAARTNSFAQRLVNGSLDRGFASALGGAASFAREEVVARKINPVLAGSAEISDASDSTRDDISANLRGIESLLVGRAGRVSEPSFVDRVRADHPERGAALLASLEGAIAAADKCPPLGGAAVDPSKRAALEATRDAQLTVAARLEEILALYGLTR
jgi:putative iron-regulated protein